MNLATLGLVLDTSGVAAGVQAFGRGMQQVGRDAQGAQAATARVSSALETSVRQLQAFAKVSLGGLGVRQLIQYADGWANVAARISLTTRNTADLARVQGQLFDIAQRTRQSFEGTADLYSKVARSAQQLGLSQREVATVTETVAQGLVISGASASEASAAILQLGQALGSGRLQGDELRSLTENASGLAQAIATGLGVNGVAALRQLGEQGELTSERVVQALLRQSAAVEASFARFPTTIGQAFQQLENALQRFVGTTADASGGARALAAVIGGIARSFDTIATAALAAAAVYTTRVIGPMIASAQRFVAVQAQTLLAEREGRAVRLQSAEADFQRARAAAATTEAERLAARATVDRIAADRQALLVQRERAAADIAEAQARAAAARASGRLGVSDAQAQAAAARQRLAAINVQLATTEEALAAAGVGLTASANAATLAQGRLAAATTAATVAARVGAVAGRAWAGALALVGGIQGAAILAVGAAVTYLATRQSAAEQVATTFADRLAATRDRAKELGVALERTGQVQFKPGTFDTKEIADARAQVAGLEQQVRLYANVQAGAFFNRDVRAFGQQLLALDDAYRRGQISVAQYADAVKAIGLANPKFAERAVELLQLLRPLEAVKTVLGDVGAELAKVGQAADLSAFRDLGRSLADAFAQQQAFARGGEAALSRVEAQQKATAAAAKAWDQYRDANKGAAGASLDFDAALAQGIPAARAFLQLTTDTESRLRATAAAQDAATEAARRAKDVREAEVRQANANADAFRERVTSAQQSIAALARQADDERLLAIATLKGADAVREQTIALKVRDAILANPGASPAVVERLIREAEGYRDIQRAADAATKAQNDQRDADARQVREAAERARQQQQSLAAEQLRQARQPYENAARAIQQAFSDAFARIFTDGLRGFRDFAQQLKTIFARLVAEILAARLAQRFAGSLAALLPSSAAFGSGPGQANPFAIPGTGTRVAQGAAGALGAGFAGFAGGQAAGAGARTTAGAAVRGAAGGALSGAAAGAAIGGPIGAVGGAIIGGIAGLIGGIVGRSKRLREEQKRLEEERKKVDESIRAFITQGQTAALSEFQRQQQELAAQYVALVEAARKAGTATDALTASYEAQRAALVARQQQEEADLRTSLAARQARAAGDDAAADAIERQARAEAELRDAVAKGYDAQTLAAIRLTQAMEEQAAAAAREAAAREAEAQRARERAAFLLDLRAREAQQRGDPVGAARLQALAQADEQREAARRLLEAGRITREEFERLGRVLDTDVVNAVKAAEQAAQDAAAALAREAEARAQRNVDAQADAQVRLLAAQGRTAEAEALRLTLAQQREYQQAVQDGLDAATLAAIRLAQQAEAAAAAAEAGRRQGQQIRDFGIALAEAELAADPTNVARQREVFWRQESQRIFSQIEQYQQLADAGVISQDDFRRFAKLLTDQLSPAAMAAADSVAAAAAKLAALDRTASDLSLERDVLGQSASDFATRLGQLYGFANAEDARRQFVRVTAGRELTDAERQRNRQIEQYLKAIAEATGETAAAAQAARGLRVAGQTIDVVAGSAATTATVEQANVQTGYLAAIAEFNRQQVGLSAEQVSVLRDLRDGDVGALTRSLTGTLTVRVEVSSDGTLPPDLDQRLQDTIATRVDDALGLRLRADIRRTGSSTLRRAS